MCHIKIDKNNYLRDRTVCRRCYNRNRRKNNGNTIIENEIDKQPKIDNVNNKNTNIMVSAYENHASVFVGPRNVGKIYYMLKTLLQKIGNKGPFHKITRYPNQYPNYKTSTDIKPIDKYKGSLVIFDDMLGARNCSQMDEFSTKGRHENLDSYYISQSFFQLA